VITDYAFGFCYDLLDREDFGEDFFEMVYGKDSAIWLWMQSNFLQGVVRGLPEWFIKETLPPIAKYHKFRAVSFMSPIFPFNLRKNTVLISFGRKTDFKS